MIHVLTHSFPTRPSSVLVIYETDVVARIGARVETDRRSRPIDRAFALDLVIERARAIAQADHERAARLAPDDIGIGLALLLEDILDQARKTLRALAEHALRGADEIVQIGRAHV